MAPQNTSTPMQGTTEDGLPPGDAGTVAVQVLIPSRNRPAALRRCIESVFRQQYPDITILVGDDASSPAVDVSGLPHSGRISVLRSDEQIGLIGMRARLMQASVAPVLLILDDDVALTDEQCISTIVTLFSREDSPALVAPIVIDHIDGKQKVLGPAGIDGRREPVEVGTFVGAAFAVRRDAAPFDDLVASGYGHEEIEFSFRIAAQGLRMICDPSIEVYHFREASAVPGGEARRRFRSAVRNRILISRKYLPHPYRAVHIGLWIVRYFLMAVRRRMLVTYGRGLISGLTSSVSPRRVLTRRAVSQLAGAGGRVWY